MSTKKKDTQGVSIPDLFATLTVNGQALASMPKERLCELVSAWDSYIERLSSTRAGTRPDNDTLQLISLARLRRALASLVLGAYPRLFEDVDWVLAERCALPQEVNTAHLIRAHGFEATAQYEQAIGEWDFVIARCEEVRAQPTAPFEDQEWLSGLYVQRALLAGELQRYQQVVEDCDRAELLHAACATLYSVRGLALGRLGQADRALADCDRSVALGADDPDCHFRRARLLVTLGRYEDALADFGRALELAPTAAYIERARDDATLRFFGSLLQRVEELCATNTGE